MLCLAGVPGAHTFAQLIYEDHFNYPDGPVLTAPGSPWVNNYIPTNEVQVVARKLFLTQLKQESVRVNFPSGYSTGSLYAGFTANFSALPTGAGNYFAFFRAQGVDNLNCRVWASTNGAAPGKFRLGITTISSPPNMIPADLSLGTTYLLVMRLTFIATDATSTLWINPISEEDTALRADDTQGGFGFVIGHFGFKQVAFYETPANGMGDVTVDDLRVGRGFYSAWPGPFFTAISRALNGDVTLTGAGIPTTNYLVFGNADLNTTNWQSLGNTNAGTNGLLNFVDTTATAEPIRFYRLQAN
jgi:hypothetical protein